MIWRVYDTDLFMIEWEVEAWPSGWRRTTRNRVDSNVSEVRILSLPPEISNMNIWDYFLFASLAGKNGGKSFEEDFKVAGDTPVINVETV